MVKGHIFSNYGQPKRPIILISRYVILYIYMKILCNFFVPNDHLSIFYQDFIVSRPSLPLALSVVSMEVFAPHKMAEIRPST